MACNADSPVTLRTVDRYELAEAGRWVDDRFIFVDILTGRLFEIVAETDGEPRLLAQLDVPLGAAAAVSGEPGSWIVAAGTGIAILDAAGRLEWLDRPEDNNRVPARMNDAACDPNGHFWAGSMAYDRTPGAGSLYRTDTDGTVVQVLDGLTTVNGPAFTADGRLVYFADSTAGIIYRCDADPASGNLTEPQVFIRVAPEMGRPDGMTVDNEGGLWVAIWGGGAVHRYHPDGHLLHILRVPAHQPTSVCLHPLQRRVLITTARRALRDPSAACGAILSAEAPVSGPPACGYRYSGSARSVPRT